MKAVWDRGAQARPPAEPPEPSRPPCPWPAGHPCPGLLPPSFLCLCPGSGRGLCAPGLGTSLPLSAPRPAPTWASGCGLWEVPPEGPLPLPGQSSQPASWGRTARGGWAQVPRPLKARFPQPSRRACTQNPGSSSVDTSRARDAGPPAGVREPAMVHPRTAPWTVWWPHTLEKAGRGRNQARGRGAGAWGRGELSRATGSVLCLKKILLLPLKLTENSLPF